MRVILLFTAERRSVRGSGEFPTCLQPKSQSLLAARVHELLENQGVSHQEGVEIRVDQTCTAIGRMEELRKRSAPAASRSSRAAAIRVRAGARDVINFLDLKVQVQERLSPDELVKKLELVLPARAVHRQIPAEWLDKPFRNRNRPIRVLCHQVFRIVEGFLESMQGRPRADLRADHEGSAALRSARTIARFRRERLARLSSRCAASRDALPSASMSSPERSAGASFMIRS